MPQQKWYESDEDFRRRATKENLEKASGSKQRMFESDEDYIERASREALEKAAGSRQGIFESNDHYRERTTREVLEKASGTHQRIFEKDGHYYDRATREAVEKQTGIRQGTFESYGHYVNRVLEAEPIQSEKPNESPCRPSSYAESLSYYRRKKRRMIWRILLGLLFAFIGLFAGGLVAVLLSFPLALLPIPPIVVQGILVFGGAVIGFLAGFFRE